MGPRAMISLKCPDCMAPVREGAAACTYCGATLVASGGRKEERWFAVLRVGPSNVDRVAGILGDRTDVAEARALVEQSPCEVPLGANAEIAHETKHALEEAGARVELVMREIDVPPPKRVSVTLQRVGDNHLAVIVALRSHLDVGISDAKSL